MKELAAALAVLRSARGLKQSELADRAGITRPMLSDYESGKHVPKVHTVVRLLEALDFGFAHLEQAAAFIARLKEGPK